MPEISELLQKFRIGIAGCGGLGSNCAVSLARCGIGELILADFDVVSSSNLNRQYFFVSQIGEKKVNALRTNISNINPQVAVRIYDEKLTPDRLINIFKDCEILVEAVDRAETKQMIIETWHSEFPEKFLVSGVGMAGWGSNDNLVTKRFGKLIICGDGVTEVSEQYPPLAPRVNIVSNMQANVVMELLLGKMK